MKSSKTIIYINFSPYENAGKILDYLKDTHRTILLFSFNFHRLDSHQSPSHLIVYQNNSIVYEKHLYQIPMPPKIAFLLLPIRSMIMFFQLLFYTTSLRNSYGPYEEYFTVNAFSAWCGNSLRNLGLVKKTIFWVWDYYPPIHPDRIVAFMRWLYWQFDKPASLKANTVIFLNKRLETLRKKLGVLPKTSHYKSIGIGTDPVLSIPKKKLRPVSLVFLGVLKKSQGLDLVFDAFNETPIKSDVSLHIIGGGPDEMYFKERAKHSSLTTYFYGYVPNDKKVSSIIDKCLIGIATYIPDESNVSYYSDPSKIKRYLERGLPVITTDVFDFSRQIKQSSAGIIIPYDKHALRPAIQKIMNNYEFFQKKSLLLARAYYYKTLYDNLFA